MSDAPDINNINLYKNRNSFGLYDNVDYIFTEKGLINWRSMIDKKFLVPNKQKTTETDISKLQDHEMLILLGGIKELANLRGFEYVRYIVNSASIDYCCVTCEISWIPNYETEGQALSFQSIADAHAGSTDAKMGINYLASIAENRAFVRCVRNFLRINILGKDEINNGQSISSETEETTPPSPKSILLDLMSEKDISFDKVKKRLLKDGILEASDYESVNDIPAPKIFELIEIIKNYKKT